MHVYLPEKYRSPFLHGVFLFSKVGVLTVNFDGLFALAYSSHLLWSWPLERIWYHHTSLSSAPLSQGLPILPDIFLRKGIMEPTLPCIFLFPLSLIMPSSIQFGFGDEAIWRKVWQWVVFMQKFWNFKAIPDTKIILTSIQSKLILKKFKWTLWRGFQKWWKLFDFGEKYEVTSGWSQKV
jgi:hypothetical protein